jgi:hypothetical protein
MTVRVDLPPPPVMTGSRLYRLELCLVTDSIYRYLRGESELLLDEPTTSELLRRIHPPPWNNTAEAAGILVGFDERDGHLLLVSEEVRQMLQTWHEVRQLVIADRHPVTGEDLGSDDVYHRRAHLLWTGITCYRTLLRYFERLTDSSRQPPPV